MNDQECLALLTLLHKYVTKYSDYTDIHISELAEDLAMSMDVTTDEADNMREEICSLLA